MVLAPKYEKLAIKVSRREWIVFSKLSRLIWVKRGETGAYLEGFTDLNPN